MPKPASTNEAFGFRQIALVAGYHPCSFPPSIAYDNGLRARFAVVLSSYHPEKDGMFFDADLFVLLAYAMLKVIPHDSLSIETGDSSRLPSLPDLVQQYADQDETDREPPDRIKVSCSGRLVAVEETEAWMAVGGPTPYHDSYTFSFYTAEDRSTEFRRVCETVARESGTTLTAFYQGQRNKEPFIPWWRQPLRWIGAKPW
jgi:hypothetical protein